MHAFERFVLYNTYLSLLLIDLSYIHKTYLNLLHKVIHMMFSVVFNYFCIL